MRKKKFLNIALIVTLLNCYIDIPKFGKEFFLQTELKLIPIMFYDPAIFILLLLLLSGQLFLMLGIITKNYRQFTIAGLICSSIIFILIFLFSISKLLPMISTIPYIVFAVRTSMLLRQPVQGANQAVNNN
jgi:hypothetical protein